jgi:small subunit ribosomal protein S4
MPKRNRKVYSRPRKLYDKNRILEEDGIVKKYGLKSKREIWKADSAISKIRNIAKKLITKSEEERKVFLARLEKMGFNVGKISDVLSLNKEDWLKRRLQTLVFQKKLASTPKQSRQLIVHRHVKVGNEIVTIPSYIVPRDKESEINTTLVLNLKTSKKSMEEKLKQEIIEDKTAMEKVE